MSAPGRLRATAIGGRVDLHHDATSDGPPRIRYAAHACVGPATAPPESIVEYWQAHLGGDPGKTLQLAPTLTDGIPGARFAHVLVDGRRTQTYP